MLDKTTRPLLLAIVILALGPFGAAAAEPTVPPAAAVSDLCPPVDLGVPPQVEWQCLPCLVDCGPAPAAPAPRP